MFNLQKLIDDTTKTESSCETIGLLAKRLEEGTKVSPEDCVMILQDLARLRYNHTVKMVQNQVVEILSRSWSSSAEALVDLKRAKKLLNWVISEYRDISGDEAQD